MWELHHGVELSDDGATARALHDDARLSDAPGCPRLGASVADLPLLPGKRAEYAANAARLLDHVEELDRKELVRRVGGEAVAA